MNLQNIKKLKNEKGFTIVELLIVIVVIGILAAIVIVAYQGVTARANTSTANSAASSIMKKAEAYASEEGNYPASSNLLSPATTTKSYSIAGSGASFVAAYTTKPATPNTLTYYTCGASLGNKIAYWDFTNGAVAYVYSGSVTASTPTSSCTVQTTP